MPCLETVLDRQRAQLMVNEAPGTRGPDPILDLAGKLRRSEGMPGSPLDEQDVVAVIAE
jgi:hypothetical protein